MKWIGQHIFDLKSKFRNDVDITGDVTITGTLDVSGISTSATHFVLGDDDKIKLGAGDDGEIYVSGDDLYIVNTTDDKDIIFQSDDGSGGVETYFFLDGSYGANPYTIFPDNSTLAFGTNRDLLIVHDATDSKIDNNTGDLKIRNFADDKDIILYSDDGSGGTTAYLTLDGSATQLVASKNLKFDQDNSQIFFNGTNTFVGEASNSGKLQLRGGGSTGASTVYIDSSGNVGFGIAAPSSKLDVRGTLTVGVDDTGHDVTFYGATSGRYMRWDESGDALHLQDSTPLKIGTGGDLQISHNGSNNVVTNINGHLEFINYGDNTDIKFSSDDGSGGTTEYFRLDGGAAIMVVSKEMRFADSVKLKLGNGPDSEFYHDGSNTYITNATGNLYIDNGANDADIIFKGTDATADITALTLDMSAAGQANFNSHVYLPDAARIKLGAGHDLQMWHESNHSYIANATGNLTITNNTDDADIIFQSDDGSGGVATYFSLDGSLASSGYYYTKFPDQSTLSFGDANDLQIIHSGGNSLVRNFVGDLYISQYTDDGDIILSSDDGSGGLTAYLTLDGGLGHTTIDKRLRANDNVDFTVGTGNDLRLIHDGTHSYMTNYTGDFYIANHADDKDIIFQSDDGSGGLETYFFLDGSLSGGNPYTIFPDNSNLTLGTGSDLTLAHDGSNSYINNITGNLIINSKATDADLILKCDDGSGGETAYLTLDGGLGYTTVQKRMKFDDNTQLQFGNGGDLQFYHTGGIGVLYNNTGHFRFRQNTNDGDIDFQCDDGAGGVTTYFLLDGSAATHDGSATTSLQTMWPDNSRIVMGDGSDLDIFHDGSNSYLRNSSTSGDLKIVQGGEDKDIKLICDNGSGGTTEYITLDGSTVTVEVAKEMNLAVPLATDQQKHVMHYQLAGYGTGDGTNYETTQNLHDNNAPFEHNISVGSDGVTALTVANMSRTGGHIMPRACTLRRWTGWGTCVGSQTAYIGLFKVSFTRNDATDLSLVLLDEFSYTAMGNNAMEDFDETSFTATALAAGDMIITAIKSQSGMVQYFNSTVEVEF
ncbi:hypothetical protein OAT73_07280 [Candidatus Poseidoniaceae archaeon]|nr:hypothetical protein [Candidatus Poseidoniaceae archaeon]